MGRIKMISGGQEGYIRKYNALSQYVKKVQILESLKLLTDMYGIFLAFILRYLWYLFSVGSPYKGPDLL